MPNADALEIQARRVRARALTRSWEYRQRAHAGGVWFRLRRLLAGARACWRIPEAECEHLIAEGHAPAPVGLELEPPKKILTVPAARIEQIAGREPLRVALNPELLAAPCLVLEMFEGS